MEDELWTAAQLGEFLQKSPWSVYQGIRAGTIAAPRKAQPEGYPVSQERRLDLAGKPEVAVLGQRRPVKAPKKDQRRGAALTGAVLRRSKDPHSQLPPVDPYPLELKTMTYLQKGQYGYQ